jgi:hypothetical protein
MNHKAPTNNPRFRPRAILTEAEAVEIYQCQRTKPMRFRFDPALTGKTSAVAKKYNVSPKAVRDIWNRRTWTMETQHLWSDFDKPMVRGSKLNDGRFGNPQSRSSSSDSTSNTTSDSSDHLLELYASHMNAVEFTKTIYDETHQRLRSTSWSPAPSIYVCEDERGWELPGCLEVTDDPFHEDWPFW